VLDTLIPRQCLCTAVASASDLLLSTKKGAEQPPTFQSRSTVAKRSPISATAELLLEHGGLLKDAKSDTGVNTNKMPSPKNSHTAAGSATHYMQCRLAPAVVDNIGHLSITRPC